MIDRPQKQAILEDLKEKMVFLVGPRQVGKTFLAREIMKEYNSPLYLNYDLVEHRTIIRNGSWGDKWDLIVFDEIHKMPKWKNFLKGHFDIKNQSVHFLVTGSARMEIFRQAGDSLAGRFFIHHLLPLSLKELENTIYKNDLNRLLERGGYPEPYLKEDKERANKWRENYIDTILRNDVFDFADIDKLRAMQDVFKILRTKVGSPISYTNIAQDIGISSVTVKKYIQILEAMYVIFVIKPYSKKVGRAILKEPKIYFYDTGLVEGDEGIKFENLIGNALLKDAYARRDKTGKKLELVYLKNKNKQEVDFAVAEEYGELEKIYEVKLSDRSVSKGLSYFTEKLNVVGVQVVKNINTGFVVNEKIEVREAKEFLGSLYL